MRPRSSPVPAVGLEAAAGAGDWSPPAIRCSETGDLAIRLLSFFRALSALALARRWSPVSPPLVGLAFSSAFAAASRWILALMAFCPGEVCMRPPTMSAAAPTIPKPPRARPATLATRAPGPAALPAACPALCTALGICGALKLPEATGRLAKAPPRPRGTMAPPGFPGGKERGAEALGGLPSAEVTRAPPRSCRPLCVMRGLDEADCRLALPLSVVTTFLAFALFLSLADVIRGAMAFNVTSLLSRP